MFIIFILFYNLAVHNNTDYAFFSMAIMKEIEKLSRMAENIISEVMIIDYNKAFECRYQLSVCHVVFKVLRIIF